MKRIDHLISRRNALARELSVARKGQHALQHQIDILSIEIAELSAMPSIVADVIRGDLLGGLGFGRCKRRRI